MNVQFPVSSIPLPTPLPLVAVLGIKTMCITQYKKFKIVVFVCVWGADLEGDKQGGGEMVFPCPGPLTDAPALPASYLLCDFRNIVMETLVEVDHSRDGMLYRKQLVYTVLYYPLNTCDLQYIRLEYLAAYSSQLRASARRVQIG